MNTQHCQLPDGVIEQVWLQAGKARPRFRSDGKASVRCVFSNRHKHRDRKPSAYLDRKSNIYGCICLGKPLTAKALAQELNVDWSGILARVLPRRPFRQRTPPMKHRNSNAARPATVEIGKAWQAARQYTDSRDGRNDPARTYLKARGLEGVLDLNLVAFLPPDGHGLPKATAHHARKGFRIAAPTYSLTTGEQAALVLRNLERADADANRIRTYGTTSGTAFCNEPALRLIRGGRDVPDRILTLEGLTDHLACFTAFPGPELATIGFPGVKAAQGFFESGNGAPPTPWIERRSFILAFDADGAGQRTTERVISALGKYIGVRLHRVSWPEGYKDAAQVLEKLGPGALREAVIQAEEVPTQRTRFARIATSGEELLTAKIERPESLVGDGLLTRGTLALLFGRPGVSKTWAALQLAHAIAAGRREWFGLPTGTARVGYLSLELPDFYLQQRLRAIAIEGECLEGLKLVYRPRLSGAVDLVQGDTTALMEWCQRDGLGLLILDPLSRVHRADENSAREIAAVLESLELLCQETGASVLLVHHERKTSAGGRGGGSDKSELDLLRGSSRLQSDPTLIMHLADWRGSPRLTFPKPNLALEPDPVYLQQTAEGPLTLGDKPLDRSETKRRRKAMVAEFLARHWGEEYTTRRLMRELHGLGVKERTLQGDLKELEAEGRVVSIGSNKGRRWKAVVKVGSEADEDAHEDDEGLIRKQNICG